jgi:thiosulfate/3-mercaptopyruvate sulfurtransferase
MDGGLAAWESSGGEIECGPPSQVDGGEVSYQGASLDASLVATWESVLAGIQPTPRAAAAAPREVVILDARPPARFEGLAPEPRPVIATPPVRQPPSRHDTGHLKLSARADFSVPCCAHF